VVQYLTSTSAGRTTSLGSTASRKDSCKLRFARDVELEWEEAAVWDEAGLLVGR